MTRALSGSRVTSLLLSAVVIVWLFGNLDLAMANQTTRSSAGLFAGEQFSPSDAVLVVNPQGQVVYSWQADQPLVPASVIKLVTAYLALQKWGEDYRFQTEFFVAGETLWVKGYGDPFLISEELDLIAAELLPRLPGNIQRISVDASYFADLTIPGRSRVDDPYNAPASAVSANFNTVMLRRDKGKLRSAEPQTPLTETAVAMAGANSGPASGRPFRVNLQTPENAQRHFAQLLRTKMGLADVDIEINQVVPPTAALLYRHRNSRSLSEMIRGALEYSNNFIANQLFLLLADGEPPLNLPAAVAYSQSQLQKIFEGTQPVMVEGAGLSRQNRISARQVVKILQLLQPHKQLLKQYPLQMGAGQPSQSIAYAKSGSLDGVHTLAGFATLPYGDYRFVFLFNRKMPYRYREQLLQTMVTEISNIHARGS